MILKRLHDAWHGMWGRLFDGLLPQRTKRLVCLASLSAFVKGSTNFDAETIAKLNQVMALCNEDKAVILPVHLSKAIWFDNSGQRLIPLDILNPDIINEHDPIALHKAVDAVLAVMPKWMRYGDETEIAKDVQKLLDQGLTATGTA